MGVTKINRAVFSGVRQDWATPRSLFDEFDREFHFTLDVCADKSNAKCSRYFDRKADGLRQRWSPETCWMNPPYGKDLKLWMAKAYAAACDGATVVCLVPARTDTVWFHDYALHAAEEIRFLRGRIRFDDGDGRATFPSCLVVFRPERALMIARGGL